MPNAIYNGARSLAATTGLNWTTATFKAYLVDTSVYSFDIAHDYLDDVTAGARIAGPITLAGNTVVDGACDADDIVFPAVAGPEVGAMVIFIDTGVEATSPLVCYIDEATGLPITPDGSDIVAEIDPTTNRLFKL